MPNSKIVPGLYLVDKIRGGNVYLLANDELVLIDTGMPGNAGQILKFIKKLGRDPNELVCVIITHSHIDHMGSLSELQATTKFKTLAHENEMMSSSGGKYILSPHLEGSRGIFLKLLVRFGVLKPSLVDLPLSDGQVLPYLGGLRVIHTPGHTKGSVCLFFEKSKVLFVGDTIINNEDRLSRPLPFGANRLNSERSLMKLTKFDFDICCFGHGHPLFSAKKKIGELVLNSPTSPIYWRIARNWNRLIHFGLGVWRRK